MKCTCKNCKHCLEHPDGLMCGNKMVFVDKEDTCLDWDTYELFKPTKLIAFTIIAVGIVIFLAKIL